MELQDAKELLDDCVRSELQDHAFGDAEVYWEKDGTGLAEGYFGRSGHHVWIADGDGIGVSATFQGVEADELRKHGKKGLIERNDAGDDGT